jgi:hypothetical protein
MTALPEAPPRLARRETLERSGREVMAMTISGANAPEGSHPRQVSPPSLAEQLRTLNPPPLGDGSYYAQDDVFSSDEEMEAFVASVYEARRAGIA